MCFYRRIKFLSYCFSLSDPLILPSISLSLTIHKSTVFVHLYLSYSPSVPVTAYLTASLSSSSHYISFLCFFFTFRPAPFIYLLPSQYPIWQVRTVNQIARYVQGCSYTSKVLRIKADIKVKLVAAESRDIFRRRWWRPNYSLKESEYKMYDWWYWMIVSAQCAERQLFVCRASQFLINLGFPVFVLISIGRCVSFLLMTRSTWPHGAG